MKTFISFATILLAASPVIASPVSTAVNGILTGTPSLPRGLHEAQENARGVVVERADCNADNVLRGLRNPTQTASARSFCSSYLQSTSTVTATTIVPVTTVIPATTTVVVVTTETDTVVVASTTFLCPAQATATLTTCAYPAYGFESYVISTNPDFTVAQCQQLCLSDPSCQSYQIQSGGEMYCNLYNEPTYGYTQHAPGDVFKFYDRDCMTDFTPAGCSHAAMKAKRAVATPTYLTSVPPSRVSSACSCFITCPNAPTTKTIVVPVTSITTATTVIPVTVTTVQTSDVPVTTTVYLTAAP